MNRVLLCLFLISSVGLSAQNLFLEKNFYCSDRTKIADAFPWGEHMFCVIECKDEFFDYRSFECVTTEGASLWQLPFVNYIDDYEVQPDNSVWLLEVQYGCDYIGSTYAIRRYNEDGAVEFSLDAEGFDDGDFGLEIEWIQNQICALNDSILVVGSSAGLSFFNTNTEEYFTRLDITNEWTAVSELVSLEDELAVALANDSVYVVEAGGNLLWSGPSIGPEAKVVAANTGYILYDQTMAIHYNSNGEEIASWQPDLNIWIDRVEVQGSEVFLLLNTDQGNELLTLDTDFQMVNSWAISDPSILVPRTAVRVGDFMFIGGQNGHHGSHQGVLKEFDLEGTTATYDMDIELLAIACDGVETYVVDEVFDVYGTQAVGIEVEIRNNGEFPITGFAVYAEMDFLFSWCGGPEIASEYVSESIMPGEVFTFDIEALAGETIFEPEEGEQFTFDKCFWLHGPDGKMDDLPENDYLCVTEDWLFTSITELESSSISMLYMPSQDLLRLNADSEVDWMLLDLSGRIIESGFTGIGGQSISTANLRAGIYICAAKSTSHTETLKFFVD